MLSIIRLISHNGPIDVNAPYFEVSDIEFASLFIKTMHRCGIDLLQFDDAQVDQGLWYIFMTACSDYMLQLKSASVPKEDKARAKMVLFCSLVVVARSAIAKAITGRSPRHGRGEEPITVPGIFGNRSPNFWLGDQ